ncbi:MAG: dihydroneopterin aldolase, partial [Chlorobiaceae bacterium]|nr:dihydroneopterin aldolase [Chlorobiaceae bacterium]
LLQEFPLLEGVTVKVRKKNVPLGGLCDHAEAEYRIDRS